MNDIILKSPKKIYYEIDKVINDCPECRGVLNKEEGSILLSAKSKKEEASFMTSVPDIRICHNCTLVVFRKSELEKSAILGFRIKKEALVECEVLGIIDTDKMIENKSNHPVDYEKTEPLVNSNKISRNEKCPCGSGKKYKRCCLKNDNNKIMSKSISSSIKEEVLKK